jgi:trans-aconitate methyltransferase
VASRHQTWDPQRYERNARFVSDLGMPVLELLAPQSGERVLDLGCGDGALTRKLVERGCRVVGVDGSEAFVAAARARGIDARVMDGQALPFESEFDAVFSNAALHWMKRDPGAVIDGVWRALVPGGRFVGELGGHGCVAAIVTALLWVLERRGIDGRSVHPWYFPTADRYAALLERRGFRVRDARLIPRPTPLPGDVTDWLETFANPFLAPVPEGERPRVLAELREALRPTLCDDRGRWTADYVRLRFAAVKPTG